MESRGRHDVCVPGEVAIPRTFNPTGVREVEEIPCRHSNSVGADKKIHIR